MVSRYFRNAVVSLLEKRPFTKSSDKDMNDSVLVIVLLPHILHIQHKIL